MLARQRVALVQEKADPRTGTEHAEAGFDLHLLGVMASTMNTICPTSGASAPASLLAIQGGVSIDDIQRSANRRVISAIKAGHLIARKQLWYMRSTATGREYHQICDVRLNQQVGQFRSFPQARRQFPAHLGIPRMVCIVELLCINIDEQCFDVPL